MYHTLYLLVKENSWFWFETHSIVGLSMFKLSYPNQCIFGKVGITFYFNLDPEV